MARSSSWLGWVVLALAVRIGLFSVPGLSHSVGSRVEVSSPISSFKRLTESLFLLDHGHSAYEGDVFHQPPLLLLLFYPLRNLPLWATQLLFAGLDCIVAFALRSIALHYGRSTTLRVPSAVPLLSATATAAATSALPVHVTVDVLQYPILQHLPELVACSYLLNPYTIATAVGMSTAGFVHASVALAVCSAIGGYSFSAAWWLAVAMYLDVYPVFLAVPIVLLLHDARHGKSAVRTRVWATALEFLLVAAAWLAALLWLSFLMIGDWSFAWKSYGCAFFVTDLTPSVGLFWYLFTEMFERFRTFFLVVAHSHLAFYVAPLTIRFSDEPLFLAWTLTAITLVFKSYPVVGDMAFSVCFLLTQSPLVLPKMRRIFPLVWLLLLSSCLTFLMWFLWIYPGSGNANFFYFQTLIFVFCNAFIVIEAIGSVRRLKVAQEAAKLAEGAAPEQQAPDAAAAAAAATTTTNGNAGPQ